MSKNEGELLKLAIRKAKYTVEAFAKEMGYTSRTSLNYWLAKERIDYDVKENAANVLGVTVNELFDEKNSSIERSVDTEKEALRDLVDAQKQLINHWRETVVGQLLRNEALLLEILYRDASRGAKSESEKLRLQTEAKAAVEARFQELRDQVLGTR